MTDQPKITVLMPVYNGDKYLREAIESVLSQTYRDFEFLIINDGSKDKSQSIIESYSDNRIRLLNNDGNKGLVYSLNRGIDCARGQYIARLDSDDVCAPNRLELQVDFMENHPDIAICGTAASIIGKDEAIINPLDPDEVRAHLFFYCCFVHPSVMMRRHKLINNHHYYKVEDAAEDYDLWVNLAKDYKLANLSEKLLYYRHHDNQRSAVTMDTVERTTDIIRRKQINEIGIQPTVEEFEIHKELCYRVHPSLEGKRHLLSKDTVEKFDRWIEKLIEHNEKYKRYPETFKAILQKYSDTIHAKISIISEIDKQRPIYIWGTGTKSISEMKVVSSYGLSITGFLDNSENKWGKKHEGLLIDKPTSLNISRIQPYIIISSTYKEEIRQQLVQLGFKRRRDFVETLDF